MDFICPTSQNQKSNTEVIENQQKQTGENSSNSIIFTLTQINYRDKNSGK